MECVTCGGKEFYKELGHFYCLECQTQSQEVRVHEFQDEIGATNLNHLRKIKVKRDKPEKKLTSWECYNIILHSLSNQLVELGADKRFKSIVKVLWFTYLEKLELLDLEVDSKPKFPAVNLKRDMRILYGLQRRNQKRKKSTSDESSHMDVSSRSSSKRERTKKKSALAQAQYESAYLKSTQESSLLGTETLDSLRTSVSEKSESFRFGRLAKRELRRNTTKSHIKEHEKDFCLSMNCHKLIYAERSDEYERGVRFVSLGKLYGILYLGLLINKEQILLGDMLRFIREGHLSYSNYSHLLEDDDENKDITFGVHANAKNNLFSHRYMRITTYKLAEFIGVLDYIVVPNVVQLCERYCKEMNLPDEMVHVVKVLLSKTTPQFEISHKHKIIPNYEGRCMSVILFVMKLCFSLDGVTEFKQSHIAKILNTGGANNRMFDLQDWLTHIEFRRVVMEDNHFPTAHALDHMKIDSDLFLQYVVSHDIQFEARAKLTKEMKAYKELFKRLKDLQYDFITHLPYLPSLTPYNDYTNQIIQIHKERYHSIIRKAFTDEKLEYIIRPDNVLGVVDTEVRLKNGIAIEQVAGEPLKTAGMKRNHKCMTKFYAYPLKLTKDEKEVTKSFLIKEKEYKPSKLKYKPKFKSGNNKSYEVHYLPHKKYWLHLLANVEALPAVDFNEFYDKHPGTFKKIFQECCRITEQLPQELYQEFQNTEFCLVYAINYSDEPNTSAFVDDKLVCFINKAISLW